MSKRGVAGALAEEKKKIQPIFDQNGIAENHFTCFDVSRDFATLNFCMGKQKRTLKAHTTLDFVWVNSDIS